MIVIRSRPALLTFVAGVAAGACSSDESGLGEFAVGNGGGPSTITATGGSTGASGAAGQTTPAGTGGSNRDGSAGSGARSGGPATATGGATGVGGATGTGGALAAGGVTGAGGDTGGATGAGGSGAGGASGVGGTTNTGGAPNTGGSTGAGGVTGVTTDPNLKVAFIGDTDAGSNYTAVLNLIKNEGVAAVVVEGDMSYSANPTAWWNATEAALGNSFPIFISRGNHDDSSWSGYLPKAAAHLGGATRSPGAHDANYKTTFRGLVIASIRKGDSGANITPLLDGDPHIWKVCNWHQNQEAMQIGGKGDEMGWDVYETCRRQGAIIETGHEHSYERTRTLVNTSSQTVDSTCGGAVDLCVGPGRTFVNVVGLGGNSVRDQSRCLPATFPYGCNGEWAFVYTSNQNATSGAQFITFNAGNPLKATGYFKTITGQTVDTFTITHDP
jgi:hypothetical protein